MVRSILFAGALLASGVACAQEVAISGKDFLSGAGDAKIAELARQAAASGRTLVITAPPYWQDKAAAKAHAGAANASVRTSDAFFENVMVRVEDNKAVAKAAAAEAPPPPKPAPRPDPRPEPRSVATPAPKPAPVEPPPAPKPAVAEAPPQVKAEPTPAPAPEPAPAPAPVAAPPAPAPVAVAPVPAPAPAPLAKAAAPDPSVAARQRLSQNLNGGQAAEGTLKPTDLQKDDLLFVDGSVRAVVRRFGPRTQMYWLDGDLNLERAELVPTGYQRYRVSEPIRNISNPSLRGSSKANSLKFAFAVPDAKSPARAAIERQYNDGRNIEGTLTPAELRQGDLVYTGEGSAVVVRRTSVGIERDWLVGELDLHQAGLQTQGNAIRVLTDTVR
jgi:hypothetical protein